MERRRGRRSKEKEQGQMKKRMIKNQFEKKATLIKTVSIFG